jgi:hypothetical protein
MLPFAAKVITALGTEAPVSASSASSIAFREEGGSRGQLLF